MNTKKNKSKNRTKPPKTTQDAPTEVNVENVVVIDEDHKEAMISTENISGTIVEEEKLESDIPKKPKRKKVKKKQDVWIEEKDPIVTDELNKDSSIKTQDSETNENKTEELSTVVPTTRKKKNKGIKSVDQNKLEQAKIIPEDAEKTTDDKKQKADSANVEILETKTSELEHKDLAGSKKKKKKKNRNDSEKSDVNDACTLAFQKLLKASDVDFEKIEADVSISQHEFDNNQKDALTDSKDPQDSKDSTAFECIKSKKKNKKGKKAHGSDSNVKTLNEEHLISSDIIKPDLTVTETPQSENTIKELSPKPKAKIAKPVQKKSKGKSDSQEVASIMPLHSESIKMELSDSSITAIKDQTENFEKEIKTNLGIVTSNIATPSLETPGIIQGTCLSTETKDIMQCDQKDLKGQTSLEKKGDCPVFLENKKANEEQVAVLTKESEISGFIEVKSGKNKKKRLQSTEDLPKVAEAVNLEIPQAKVKHEIKPTSHEAKSEIFYDISQLDIKENVKPEELEGLKVSTPDLIQYPRSTSQLNIDDNNNNTVIQEITTPDEVKLGIPIYMATPIIQGSRESPDAKSLNDPIKIEISKSEPQCVKDSNEKTDIKSKMFEVNKDMEELRRSIERSLAELTGTEKCDSKVDKEFEEIFQSQNKELSTKKSTEDPSFIVDTKKQDDKILEKAVENKIVEVQETATEDASKTETAKCDVKNDVPVCPTRSKSKGKSKKKGKKEFVTPSGDTPSSTSMSSTSGAQEKACVEKESKGSEKSEEKSGSAQEKSKQQSSNVQESDDTTHGLKLDLSFEPIENFEDALTSSVDDVNKTFEIIANEANESIQYHNTPQIKVIAPSEDKEEGTKNDQKQESPISQPKNLLGHPNIPASSNKTDYKKEKSKPPSSIQAKVKIKDAVEIEKADNQAKSSELDTKLIKQRNGRNYFTMSNANEEFIYKYNFRKVFLQSVCHVCKKNLLQSVPCKFCNLVFYCSEKHKDEDWSRHQSLCFAVSTIAHLKEQKHIYADAQNITGHDYRVLRMQMIISCEKILKRKLVPWEQEAMLYPRICADAGCREWKQSRLKDCEGCAQISYCAEHPDHLPSNHQRWCKSYALYQKLVIHQQTKGRLEPKLPTKVLSNFRIPDNLNQVLGSMYEEKIDMDDIQYAALTQIATGPLTAAHAYQLYNKKNNIINGTSKKSSITIHLVATDLQYEADVLNKWEIFFLHLFDVNDLRVVLVGNDLNPSNLPLDLLAKIRLCDICSTNKRRVIFDFHDKESYQEYYSSSDFITPDIVCAFNPNIHRSSTLKTEDNWPSTLNCILKQRVPFLLTSFTINELKRDIKEIKKTNNDYITISDIKHNPFCSVRPDRNFITDHEMPLLFKNYCFTVVCGV